MARKTIEVRYLYDRINPMLDPSTIEGRTLDESVQYFLRQGRTPEQVVRMVLSNQLENVLFRSGNYRGFQFTDREKDETQRSYYPPAR